MKVTVSISTGRIGLFLILTTAVLVSLSTYLRLEAASSPAGKLMLQLFHSNLERNIPTWFSFFLLLVCALSAAIIGSVRRREADTSGCHWTSLAVIFVLLSMDELAEIHEHLMPLMDRLIPARGFFHFNWVAVGIPAVLACIFAYWRFLLWLPAATRSVLLMAAGLYVTGALAMEMLGGYYVEAAGFESAAFLAVSTLEELLEMLGATAFILATLTYMRSEWGRLTIRISTGKPFRF